jgi:MFS superfamily sulfate permease-like transporter
MASRTMVEARATARDVLAGLFIGVLLLAGIWCSTWWA